MNRSNTPCAAVWIIGDQVDRTASSLKAAPPGSPVVFIESLKSFRSRPYHWQKLVLILSAMRHFASELRAAGREVSYHTLTDDFTKTISQFVRKAGIKTLYVMEPNDHDRAMDMPAIAKKIGCHVEVTPNNQFLADHDQFAEWATGKRSMLMEFFYRTQRKRLGILLEADGTPAGAHGTWINSIGWA